MPPAQELQVNRCEIDLRRRRDEILDGVPALFARIEVVQNPLSILFVCISTALFPLNDLEAGADQGSANGSNGAACPWMNPPDANELIVKQVRIRLRNRQPPAAFQISLR